MPHTIDWEKLAHGLGAIADTPDGRTENGGTRVATAALAEILGDDAMTAAVDHYVSNRPGSEAARSVLTLLKPGAAIEHCHHIYLTSGTPRERNFAVNLLKSIGDKRVLAWLPQYLSDPNPGIQAWGVGIPEHLLLNGVVELEDLLPLLESLSDHPNPVVREKAAEILTWERD